MRNGEAQAGISALPSTAPIGAPAGRSVGRLALPGAGAALWRPGLLIARSLLDAVGGIRFLPLMEDVDIARRPAAAGLRRAHLSCQMEAGRVDPAFRPEPRLSRSMVRRRVAAVRREDLSLKDTVIIFARVPRLGAVKRRLAQGIGQRAALKSQRTTLDRLLRTLARDRWFRTVPATTGGYWPVGLGPRRPARPIAAVRWSSEPALSDTLRNFSGRRVTLLRWLRDMDTTADLPGWQA